MEAVRVPPSACRTSQSRMMVFSPSALSSTTARRDRPTKREISWVRPPILPLRDSRPERSLVARGSISYSAVTQPSPDPLRQRGTPSVTEALHSTVVRPKLTSTDPSAWVNQPRSILTSRNWSRRRPSIREVSLTLPRVVGGTDTNQGYDTVRSPGRSAASLSRARPHGPREDVGQRAPTARRGRNPP